MPVSSLDSPQTLSLSCVCSQYVLQNVSALWVFHPNTTEEENCFFLLGFKGYSHLPRFNFHDVSVALQAESYSSQTARLHDAWRRMTHQNRLWHHSFLIYNNSCGLGTHSLKVYHNNKYMYVLNCNHNIPTDFNMWYFMWILHVIFTALWLN